MITNTKQLNYIFDIIIFWLLRAFLFIPYINYILPPGRIHTNKILKN